MKTPIKFLKLTSLAIVASMALSSCGTIFASKRTQIVLVNPPKDLKVSENGVDLEIEQVVASVKSTPNTSTTYFASGVYVKRKEKNHTLVLESAGKKGKIELKSKVSGGIVFLNIIFNAGLGCFVDAATKKWLIVKDNHLDVPAILDGTQPMSQRKLKRTIKRQAEGKE